MDTTQLEQAHKAFVEATLGPKPVAQRPPNRAARRKQRRRKNNLTFVGEVRDYVRRRTGLRTYRVKRQVPNEDNTGFTWVEETMSPARALLQTTSEAIVDNKDATSRRVLHSINWLIKRLP